MRTEKLATVPVLITISLLAVSFVSNRCAAQSPAVAMPPTSFPAASIAPPDPERISVDVQVTDSLGHGVNGLTAADFTLLDNKQPARILDVREVDTHKPTPDPVHLVIVVDTINTGFDEVARERIELGQFLTQDGGRLSHPTSLALLTETGLKIDKTATTDGNLLLASLTNTKSELRMIGTSAGFWGATDRLQWSIEQLTQLAGYESTVPGRKFAFVLSPGWPLLPWAGIEATDKQEQQIFRSVETFTNGLRASHMTLYAIDPYRLGRTNPFYYQNYLKPLSKVQDATYPDLSLQVLATHSGGLVEIKGLDVVGELNEVIRDAVSYYTVTFEAPPTDRRDEYHALRLTVDRPGATARTSVGYYANMQP